MFSDFDQEVNSSLTDNPSTLMEKKGRVVESREVLEEVFATLLIPSTSSSPCSSSSSCSSPDHRGETEDEKAAVESKVEEGRNQRKKEEERGDGDEDDDDDGYHTPTSPGHAIPAPLTCPPAPLKRSLRRCFKRKVVRRQVRVLVKRPRRIVFDVAVDVEEFKPAQKKARRDNEATIAE